jgi:hypothetical protein
MFDLWLTSIKSSPRNICEENSNIIHQTSEHKQGNTILYNWPKLKIKKNAPVRKKLSMDLPGASYHF